MCNHIFSGFRASSELADDDGELSGAQIDGTVAAAAIAAKVRIR